MENWKIKIKEKKFNAEDKKWFEVLMGNIVGREWP